MPLPSPSISISCQCESSVVVRPFLPTTLPSALDDVLQAFELDLVRVVERADDEDVAAHAHDHQQQRADDREAEDAAEDDVAGPHGLGDDGVDRFDFEIFGRLKALTNSAIKSTR